MKHGPLIFLSAFFALGLSWYGFVLTPQMQVGQLQQTNAVPSGASYPLARSGEARQGLDVYRANGCATCHSQQIGQSGTEFDVVLSDAGTNQATILAALKSVAGLDETRAKGVLGALPKSVIRTTDKAAADAAVKGLTMNGSKALVAAVPVGEDISRGWGRRRTVAEDYLYDYPVMLGSHRVGPDLANVGARQPDPNWHLRHLYQPRLEVKESTMPPYRFLFDLRKIERAASPDALVLAGDQAPPAGYEVVPKPEARALVAYLLSLRADAPLFTAPLAVAAAPTTPAPSK